MPAWTATNDALARRALIAPRPSPSSSSWARVTCPYWRRASSQTLRFRSSCGFKQVPHDFFRILLKEPAGPALPTPLGRFFGLLLPLARRRLLLALTRRRLLLPLTRQLHKEVKSLRVGQRLPARRLLRRSP